MYLICWTTASARPDNTYQYKAIAILCSIYGFFNTRNRYIEVGKITATGKWLQSAANAFEPHAIHADEPSSGRYDEPWTATARNSSTR